MAILTRNRIESLLRPKAGPCISLYQPTHRHYPGTEEDPIRFKNALKEAARLLSDRFSAAEIQDLLDPVASRPSTAFWRHQADGLALFRSPDLLEEFRLPLTVPELVVVAESFHVRPLIRCLGSDERYFLVALAQGGVTVYQGSRSGLTRVEIPGLPMSLGEARGARRRAATPGGTAGRRDRTRLHPAGGVKRSTEAELVPWFRVVDGALRRALRQDGAPVILAGVEYYLPIFRRITRLRNFADAIVAGSPDALSPDQLRDGAWPVVQRLLRAKEERALESYRRAAERGRSRLDLEAIVPLARRGRVRRLFLAAGVRYWGTVDPTTGRVHRTGEQQGSHDDDVLDDVAEAVYRSGGSVVTLPLERMPDGREVAAELR